ncbi:MAG: hypothetical protein AAF772_16565 [Acidobacteriota bacterium]
MSEDAADRFDPASFDLDAFMTQLERDLPTTPEDVAALRRAREASLTMTPAAYGAFLKMLGPADIETLRARPVFSGPPFEL